MAVGVNLTEIFCRLHEQPWFSRLMR